MIKKNICKSLVFHQIELNRKNLKWFNETGHFYRVRRVKITLRKEAIRCAYRMRLVPRHILYIAFNALIN